MEVDNLSSSQVATKVACAADVQTSQTGKQVEQILSEIPLPNAHSEGQELKETVPVQTEKIATPPKSPEPRLPALHPAIYSQSVFAKIWGVALKGLQEVKIINLPKPCKKVTPFTERTAPTLSRVYSGPWRYIYLHRSRLLDKRLLSGLLIPTP